ncbi:MULTISPECIES: shikimate dehydrogenase [unclassified Caballeronia]|uniref:shikimate dehydrogenase family protein n=1 Tax=unclassified Caballeronia TaxID=2646786 RepID=UPI0028599D47|nr:MULTISPECIES: shikimate dehydrogenase [unclassified Caballeronia]MDR5741191.1 shikimate dehydrogenase [Caballeronia sp. LZ016]MDR5807089.1 shikimate dehydrogenase [Caballeronia sp. LZ019]
MTYEAAGKPTFWFIGVTTAQSSIMRVFPEWARHLGLGDVEIKGMDFAPHADAAKYREAVRFLRDDPLSLGALVTTHKIDLYAACHDLFDDIDEYARTMGETSCLSKRDGRFVCHAKDPITAGFALDGFLPAQHFSASAAEVFVMGAGGSAIAITWHLMQKDRGADRPASVIVSDPSRERLEEIERIHRELDLGVPCEYILVSQSGDNDRVMTRLSPGALVINATGLGKDAPGSPLTQAAVFPERAIVWELNYRGELVFLDQARTQQDRKRLQVEDGWTYFIYGWTRVMAEVFHVDIPTRGPAFEALCRIAADAGKPAPRAGAA